jgi:hypothetical protein
MPRIVLDLCGWQQQRTISSKHHIAGVVRVNIEAPFVALVSNKMQELPI